MILKTIAAFFSFLFLIYLVAPGPTSINNFPALPESAKSTLSGDTVQVPNVTAYFSDKYRNFATSFYKQSYHNQHISFIPPLVLNYPPEFAYTAIKDQTESTYLEEYIYPLKDSLYVNGFEPFYEDGQPKFWGSTQFQEGGAYFYTKTTLRFYPSSLWTRLLIWFGINASALMLWRMGRKILSHA